MASDGNEEAQPEQAIVLPPNVGFPESEDFLEKLKGKDCDTGILIDASGVERLSGACILTVVSTIRHCESLGQKVTVINPATPFVDAFSEMGFFQDLMKMEFRQ